MLMVRGEWPTMIPVNGADSPGGNVSAAECPLLPPSLPCSCCPKRSTTISGQTLTWIPSARLFCLLSGRTKRDQKWGRSSGFLRREGDGAGTIPSGHSPQARGGGESEGGQRLGWGTSGVAWLRSGTPAGQQRGIQQEAPARQFTELSRPRCKFLVRRP